jgi:hypothetical protein
MRVLTCCLPLPELAGILGQESGTGVFEAVGWMAVLLVIMTAAAIAVGLIRRRLHRRGSASGEPFTLESLRVLREQGRLTDAEYESLKRRVIADVESPRRVD